MANLIPAHRPPLVYLLVAGAPAFYGWTVVVTTFWRPGVIGLNYDAPGTDYMVFHTAVSLVLQGDLSTLYDPDRFTALLNRVFHGNLSEDLAFRPWIYPPPFLLLLLPFGLLSFGLSYGLFQLATALAMLGALRAATGRRAHWVGVAALLCPAASISVVSGQSSFLIVALLAAGTGLLDRRPALAGIIFGLLSFKPQFVLMIPVVLLGRTAWRASAVAAATSIAMAASCLLWLGPAMWTGWFGVIAHSVGDADGRWFLLGRLWGESVYTCVYLLGAPRVLAEAAQLGAILLAGGAVCYAFRRPMASAPRAAVLLAASLLAAPHSGGYDLVLLVAAWGLLLSHLGPRACSSDWFLGLLVWLAPLLGLPVLSLVGRFCPVLILALLGRIFWHADTPRRIEVPA
jgi:alpha-1,2-mannosyltransferase